MVLLTTMLYKLEEKKDAPIRVVIDSNEKCSSRQNEKENSFLKPLQKILIVAWKKCQPYVDGELLWRTPSPAEASDHLIILYTPASVDPCLSSSFI